MKLSIFAAILLFSANVLIAQDFAPVGAEWYYTEEFAFSGDVDYIKFTSEKDTLVLGENCRKITKRHKVECNERPLTEYLFSRNDTVFFLDSEFNDFQILYDFSAEAGDSWTFNFKDEEQETLSMTVFVDSTSITGINGQDLKTLHVTYDKENISMPGSYHSIIIERIGDIQYMFNWYPYTELVCDANYSSGLRCYQDPELGLYSTGITDSCDYSFTWTGKESISQSPKIHFFPNPASDIVEIKSPVHTDYIVQILDFTGKVIFSQGVSDPIQTIDVSAIPGGIYLVLFKTGEQLIGFEKLIKN